MNDSRIGTAVRAYIPHVYAIIIKKISIISFEICSFSRFSHVGEGVRLFFSHGEGWGLANRRRRSVAAEVDTGVV